MERCSAFSTASASGRHALSIKRVEFAQDLKANRRRRRQRDAATRRRVKHPLRNLKWTGKISMLERAAKYALAGPS